MMRASNYTIFINLKDSSDTLLVHGYTGAVDIVKENVAVFLKNNLSTDMASDISEGAYKTLVNRGYITAFTYEEEKQKVKEMARLFHSITAKRKSFLFVPAYDCNFRCSYCYEDRISNNGVAWSGKTMDKYTVDLAYSAISKITQNSNGYKTIGLYGGEPLLKKNYEIIKYIVDKGIENSFNFQAVTNGYELDSFMELLGTEKINHIQITLDGPAEIHDKRRFLADGSKTFHKIVDNITLALNQGIQVSIRINCDMNNLENLNDLSEIIEGKGWNKNKNFNAAAAPVRVSSSHSQDRYESCTSFSNRSQFIKKFLKKKDQGKIANIEYSDLNIISKIKATLSTGKLLNFKSAFCGANNGMFLFDPFGDIYPCWEVIGKEYGKIGRYAPDLELNEAMMKNWFGRDVATNNKCLNCKYAFFCGGGCEAYAFDETKNYMSSYCDSYQSVFKEVVPRAYKQYLNENSLKY